MTNMSSRSGDLINRALRKSLSSGFKRAKLSTVDDHIAASARRVLSTKIEYVHCPQYSTEEFLKSLKTKYIVLTPLNKPKKKKKKKNKLLNSENSKTNPSSMKNTELNGQNLSLPTPKYTLFPPDEVQLGWKGPVPVGCGFINLGTTCYINSTLQALFHVPSFVNWLKEDKKHEANCEKMNGMFHSECIVCAMAKTLQISHRNSSSSWKPKYIIEKIKTICKHLSPFRQEDAHEFLRYLMEAMEKSYTTALGLPSKKLDIYSKETTPLNQIFGGYIRTEVTCLECSHVSTTFQHFQDLILDIRQNGITNVYEALETYFSKERLDGDESYHCEHCKKKVSAYKKFTIERAPNVLCIQLKRFNINSYYGGSKISKPISTPQTLDLSKFKHKKGSSSGTSLKYRIVSMVFHHGLSVNSGHYTALGSTSSGSYYYFNDEQSFPVNFGAYANNANTYIMFYEREKTSLINENSVNVKSAVSTSSTAIPLSNGCVNGTVPARTNGFFTKRESTFLSTSSHSSKFTAVIKDSAASVSKEVDSQKPSSYRQQSWEPVENKENEPKQSQAHPAKALVTVPAAPAPIVKSNTNSLVPYTQSSDSENSDAEGEKDATDSNNNSKSASERDEKNSVASTSMLSPLAKRNSTLTSLLTSSPKNENSAYRSGTSSPRPTFSNGKPAKSVEEKKAAGLHPKLGGRMISFSLYREKKKFESHHSRNYENETNHCKNQNAKENDVRGSDSENRGADDSRRLNGNGEETKYVSSYFQEPRENGLTNGTTKINGIINGVNGCERAKTATNGWIITEMQEDECNTNRSEKSWKIPNNRDWVVVEKENTKSSPRDSAKFKDNRKCNGNDNYPENSSSQQENENASRYNNSYSSQNGYGGKVFTWNGDVSRISRESKEERKEGLKRNYGYDDEIDRGKVKKAKYYNRNENGSSNSQMPRKNPIQQRQNQYNSMNGNGNNMNKNGNMNNHRNDKRWQFSQNGFNYPPRRHSHNQHFRHHNQNYGPHHRPGGFSQQNGWARR